MFGLAAVPSVIQFIGFLFLPDTPRWLVTKGRFDRARTVLHQIHGESVDIEQEITDINNSFQQSAENRKFCICVIILYTVTFLYISAEKRKDSVINGQFYMNTN